MSMYTEQNAFQYLERIAIALEKIAGCLENSATLAIMKPSSGSPTAAEGGGSKSRSKGTGVQQGSQALKNTSADIERM